jgi:UDP-glucuronate 4-epimerase
MRVVLTGAAGFIGSHLAERLLGRGDEVIGFDNFDQAYAREIKQENLASVARVGGRFSFVEGDVRDEAAFERCFAPEAPDVVVHLAALAGVRPSLVEAGRYVDVNLTGTQRVLDVCARRYVGRLVFASSSSVYGQGSRLPFRESDPCLEPLSPYAATKRAGELLCFTAHHLSGLSVTNLRFFTVYGPRQRPDLAIYKFTQKLLAGEPLSLYGDGESSRDYTWVGDIVDGCVAALDQLAAADSAHPHFRTYNLGGTQATSLSRMVALLEAAVGQPARIERLPPQAGDMTRTLADVSLAARELGYAPRVSIDEGIERFVRWFRDARGNTRAA